MCFASNQRVLTSTAASSTSSSAAIRASAARRSTVRTTTIRALTEDAAHSRSRVAASQLSSSDISIVLFGAMERKTHIADFARSVGAHSGEAGNSEGLINRTLTR